MFEFFNFVICFFYGWRRKIGVVTLVVAFTILGVWMRSLTIADEFTIPVWQHTVEELSSNDGKLHWRSCHRGIYHWADRTRPYEFRFEWITVPHEEPEPNINEPEPNIDDEINPHAYWRFWGIEAGDFVTKQEQQDGIFPQPFCNIHYWLIVLTLTLISFWLLLSKPRKSIQKKIIEPISIEGK